MIQLPEVIGLMLCKQMEVKPGAGGVSLLGLFNTLTFHEWPSPVQEFTVYAALSGGEGEGTMELCITRWPGEQDVYSWKRWSAFAGGKIISHLDIGVKKCVFPQPGDYALVLRFDEQILTRRLLPVQAV